MVVAHTVLAMIERRGHSRTCQNIHVLAFATVLLTHVPSFGRFDEIADLVEKRTRPHPSMLWVGCANVSDFDATQPAADLPSKEAITCHCFATAEVRFWNRLFRKIDTGPATSKLNAVIGKILGAEREITLMEQPQSK
jgi:hypothetical protein